MEYPANRFCAFKVTIDGSHRQRDHVRGLTLDQVRDPVLFPFGRLTDKEGVYQWSHCLTECLK